MVLRAERRWRSGRWAIWTPTLPAPRYFPALAILGTHPALGVQAQSILSTCSFLTPHSSQVPLSPSSVLLARDPWFWGVLMLPVLLPLPQSPRSLCPLSPCWGLQTCSWAAVLQCTAEQHLLSSEDIPWQGQCELCPGAAPEQEPPLPTTNLKTNKAVKKSSPQRFWSIPCAVRSVHR